jgi:hypothetical protein
MYQIKRPGSRYQQLPRQTQFKTTQTGQVNNNTACPLIQGGKVMKYKTTRKAIVNGNTNIISAGYCELAYLLTNHSPLAYTCGIYGWNFDVYEVYGLTICTGYRNMPGRRPRNASEFEKRAEAIRFNYDMPWDDRTEAIEQLLREFCEQA